MQTFGQAKPPQGVIFDSDLGNRVESVMALALLYGLDGRNEIRMVSVSVSKPSLESAALAEVMGRFYAGAVSGAFAAVGRTLPVGMADPDSSAGATPLLQAVLGRRNPDGSPAYQHGIHHPNDTAEVLALIRNALTSQHDQNCVMILAGPATNYARLLGVAGAREWIARKSKALIVAAGRFEGDGVCPNIAADPAAARRLFAEWPVPVIAAGAELGDVARYPGSSIERDFAWTQAHPAVDAYRAGGAMPFDAPAREMAAALYAGRPSDSSFKLSENGTITVDSAGRTRFAASADGRHRYLIAGAAQRDAMTKAFVELASAKPVPRVPRFRQPPAQQQQQQPQAPAAPPKP